MHMILSVFYRNYLVHGANREELTLAARGLRDSMYWLIGLARMVCMHADGTRHLRFCTPSIFYLMWLKFLHPVQKFSLIIIYFIYIYFIIRGSFSMTCILT